MSTQIEVIPVQKNRALAASTIAFTVCFAVWTIFSIIGIQIKQDLSLNEVKTFRVDTQDFLETIDDDPQSLHTINRILVEKIESLQAART